MSSSVSTKNKVLTKLEFLKSQYVIFPSSF